MTETIPRRRRTRNVSKFLKNRPKNTVISYRTALIRFLDFVADVDTTRRHGPRRTDPIDMGFYDPLSLEYLNSDRDVYDFGDDLQDFIRAHGDKSPKTLGGYKSVVLSWLGENHIYLPQQMTRRVKAGGKARSRDRIPTVEELRRILNHSDLHIRTLLLTLTSTGMRPGEALKIRWDDVDLKRGHIFIRAEYTKPKEARDVFISTECVEALSEWREYHDRYIEKIEAFTWQEGITRDTEEVFPATYGSTRCKFNRVLEWADLDERDPTTGRRVLHLHTMRKYFRTRLPMGGCPIDVVEELLGHEGYLTDSYVRLTLDDLERAYRQAEHELWIFKTKPINEGQLRQLEGAHQELQQKYSRLRQEVVDLTAMHEDVIANPSALQAFVDARIRASKSDND